MGTELRLGFLRSCGICSIAIRLFIRPEGGDGGTVLEASIALRLILFRLLSRLFFCCSVLLPVRFPLLPELPGKGILRRDCGILFLLVPIALLCLCLFVCILWSCLFLCCCRISKGKVHDRLLGGRCRMHDLPSCCIPLCNRSLFFPLSLRSASCRSSLPPCCSGTSSLQEGTCRSWTVTRPCFIEESCVQRDIDHTRQDEEQDQDDHGDPSAVPRRGKLCLQRGHLICHLCDLIQGEAKAIAAVHEVVGGGSILPGLLGDRIGGLLFRLLCGSGGCCILLHRDEILPDVACLSIRQGDLIPGLTVRILFGFSYGIGFTKSCRADDAGTGARILPDVDIRCCNGTGGCGKSRQCGELPDQECSEKACAHRSYPFLHLNLLCPCSTGSSPRIFLPCAAIAFLLSVYMIARMRLLMGFCS